LPDPNALNASDYKVLARIMIGPHGRIVDQRNPVDLLVVFSAADAELARCAYRLHKAGSVRTVLFSGGAGKDSGGLTRLGITEAAFLASVAIAEGLPTEAVALEQESSNGKENAEHSLRRALTLGLIAPGRRVASLAPAVRSRRLYEELRFQAARLGIAGVCAGLSCGSIDSHYDTRRELLRELRGLATMHEGPTPRIFPQDDLRPGGLHHDLVSRALGTI
jgi:hypothetical protein